MKTALTLSVCASVAANTDDATLLSISTMHQASALVDFATESAPRKASVLMQQFARDALESGNVDDVTKQKLKEIAAQLTNNTWMSLEQSHRRDQDLINKHWRAIVECGDKHIAHLKQDIDGFEVTQVRTHESDMMKCRGLSGHANPFHTQLVQNTWSIPPPEALCPADTDCVGGTDRAYFVNRNLRGNIDAGRRWCQAFGGELASIHTQEDNEKILGLLAGSSAWIGAQGTNCETAAELCDWTWEDGDSWTSPSSMGVANDGLNHNNGRLRETRICIHSDKRWHDWTHGTCPKGVVCEIKAPPPPLCCMALSLECLACAEGLTELEYCKQHPDKAKEFGFEECEMTSWNGGVDESGKRFFHHVSSGIYADPNHRSLYRVKEHVCSVCGELDAFLKELPASKPNCEPTLVATKMDPQCTTEELPLIETDLDQWFDNLVTFADYNLEKWQQLKKACDDARAAYKEKDAHCDEEQAQYETSFCAYREGLHATCAEYQGCHILTEEQFLALINDVLYAADSRKIDWKAIHKIACYIHVLISDGTNAQRTLALENCESGDLNTLASILTGFDETNYLTIIIPDMDFNVSCWDMEVPPLIDFKECDMSSVEQFPCTETWMQRYEGLESPAACSTCATLPEHMQYSAEQEINHNQLDDYGGGWIFVNELGRSVDDINDLVEISPEGYHLPSYNMKGLRYNEVLIQRVSPNWCDSWGRQTSKWVEDDGASMCVQADLDHVYCTTNGGFEDRWRQQPLSHFTSLCGGEDGAACQCWPSTDDNCFSPAATCAAAKENVAAPKHIRIHSLEEDGSVVKVSFQGEEKSGVLRVGNEGAFMQGSGCNAVTPVQYRVYVRCLGCATQRSDFHTLDGAQFNGAMTMGLLGKSQRSAYTYEAWFRSPLEGKFIREIFGGHTSGLTLVNANNAECVHYGDGSNERTTYQLHAGNTNVYSNTCFQKDLFYHVAITQCEEGTHVYVNGRSATATDGAEVEPMPPMPFMPYGMSRDMPMPPMPSLPSLPSNLEHSFGAGFTDGGQLFNVRIWDYARSQMDLIQDSGITDPSLMSDAAGLAHWWPLTDNTQDLITGASLKGPEVRYSPIWCSDLEATGMRVC